MKQFSLEEYLANPSRKVVTRDGRKVSRFLCTDAKSNYPIVTLVEESKDDECVLSYTTDGEWCEGRTSDNDLFFAPEKHEGWVNMYRDSNNGHTTGAVFDSQEDAERVGEQKLFSYVTTVKIEWEE